MECLPRTTAHADAGMSGRQRDVDEMKCKTTARRTTYNLDDGTDIAVVAPKWPAWSVEAFLSTLLLRQLSTRAAAEQHADYFAHRACAQAAGYRVRKTRDGQYAFERADGTTSKDGASHRERCMVRRLNLLRPAFRG
jgi:hypothetical protein